MHADPAVALVGIQALFNTLGVVIALSVASQLASLIVRVVPARGSVMTGQLDRSLLQEPTVAIDNVRATLIDLAQLVFLPLTALLNKGETRILLFDLSKRLMRLPRHMRN